MKRRKSYKYVYGLLVVFIGIGFAYLTANLNINGIGSFGSQSWDIHFENVVVDNTSYNPVTPTVSNDDLTITFASGLRLPGDYYKFNVDIVNDGTLDAMFDSVNVTANSDFSDYIDYTITYQSGESLAQYDLLPANSTQTVTVNFFYKDIDLEDLPTEEMELSFTLEFNYLMANENARLKKYVVSNTEMMIGNPIPDGVNLRDTPELAIADWGLPLYIKHVISNNNIIESYLEFIVTSEISSEYGLRVGKYSLKGGDGGASFDANKAVMLGLFGSNNCTDSTSSFNCNNGVRFIADDDGAVRIIYSGYYCDIYSDGSSYCDEG